MCRTRKNKTFNEDQVSKALKITKTTSKTSLKDLMMFLMTNCYLRGSQSKLYIYLMMQRLQDL